VTDNDKNANPLGLDEKTIAKAIVYRYLPDRHINHRRQMAQELYNLITRTQQNSIDNVRHAWRNMTLWGRLKKAIAAEL